MRDVAEWIIIETGENARAETAIMMIPGGALVRVRTHVGSVAHSEQIALTFVPQMSMTPSLESWANTHRKE